MDSDFAVVQRSGLERPGKGRDAEAHFRVGPVVGLADAGLKKKTKCAISPYLLSALPRSGGRTIEDPQSAL